MPPIRTITTKPVKTERTHEENQERAYIAASRRSDRSLEARVESARRASEIHKRRTGRSLRVTEQDVINEEMYEEEDDDLPLQYRRLTAHLNTNSPDFNRRLAAYLTNHVAMRNALDQAISTSYAQQNTPGSQMWAQPMQNAQQPFMGNPMMNQNFMQQTTFQPSMMMPPATQGGSPTSFQQSPYPTTQQTYRPNVQRSASTVQNTQGYNGQSMQPNQPQSLLERRTSFATVPVVSQSPAGVQNLQSTQRSNSSSSLPNLQTTSPQMTIKKSSSVPPVLENDGESMQQSAPASASAEQTPALGWSPPQQLSISPLSSTLPPDAQMFFQGGYNPMSFQQSPPTWGNDKAQQPFYSYNPNNVKQRSVHPSYDGMNQTLAPGALDNINDAMSWPTPSSASTDSVNTPFTPAFNYGFDSLSGFDGPQKPTNVDPSSIMQSGSGYVTPGEAEWSSFIDPNSWADSTV